MIIGAQNNDRKSNFANIGNIRWSKTLTLSSNSNPEYLIPITDKNQIITNVLVVQKVENKYKYHIYSWDKIKAQLRFQNELPKEVGLFVIMNNFAFGKTKLDILLNEANPKITNKNIKLQFAPTLQSYQDNIKESSSWEYTQICMTSNASCSCPPSYPTCDMCPICLTTQCWGNWIRTDDAYLDPLGGGGGADGSGDGGSGGGGGSVTDYSFVNILSNYITLNSNQINWLGYNSQRAIELINYFEYNNNATGLQEKALDHINRMMADITYLDFVQRHANTSVVQTVWWEDINWLSVPSQFNLDVDKNDDQNYDELTSQEKALVKKYPGQAYAIYKNKSVAEITTQSMFGENGLNDKSDAFRHAFFNAMNRRDCGLDFMTLENIAKLFSDAHESETPSQLLKEKEMDLWNNNVGHLVGGDLIFPALTSDSYLSNIINDKLAEGSLRYLYPLLTALQDPNYYGMGGVLNPRTATHGITSLTQLKPTNP